MKAAVQGYENHRRYVIGYHMVATLLLFAYLVYVIYVLIVDFSVGAIFALFLGITLMLVGFYAREFALRVQDRVIRLEERHRLAQILPEDLKSSIPSLTIDQLVALRFASDDELPELTRRVLSENITDREHIKKLIKNWRPDDQRI